MLLSADALLVTATLANVAHKTGEISHQAAPSEHGTFQDSVAYHPTESGGIFDGVATQAIQFHETSSAPKADHSDKQAGIAIQAKTTTVTVVSKISGAVNSAAAPAISATSTISSGNVATQQLTASLTASNGPPAATTVSQSVQNQSVSSAPSVSSTSATTVSPHTGSSPVDLYTQVIADINATNAQSGGSTHTTSYGPISGSLLGGAITFTNAVFTFTLDGSNKVATVTVAADSASLILGGTVT